MSYNMERRFAAMREGYPVRGIEVAGTPCGFVDNFCASKVTVSLYHAKVIPELISEKTILNRFLNGQGVTPYKAYGSSCRMPGESPMHLITGAEPLANFLRARGVFGTPKVWKRKLDENFDKTVSDSLSGKRGIILFKDYWARSGESVRPTGDHIDLLERNGSLVGGGSQHTVNAIVARCQEVWLFE